MKTTHKKLVGGLLFSVLIACIGTPFAVGQNNDTSENTSPTILFGTAEIQGTNGLESFGPGLTDEQQTEIDTLVKTLSDKNTSPEEINKAIQEKLTEFGVQDPNAQTITVSSATVIPAGQ